jgi:hypothetical protein
VNRRSVLASAAALLSASAGCLDRSTASGDTPGSTDSERALSVVFDRLQPGVVVDTASGPRVLGDGRQYLFCRVDTAGEPPARLDFGFRLGGQVYSPGVDAGDLHPAMWPGDRYDPESGAGWLVFDLPAAWPAGHAALSLAGDEWPVDAGIRERLAADPSALAVDWTTSAANGATSHEFAVANGGDTDTRFVGLLAGGETSGVLAAFSRRVPAGETISWTTETDAASDGSFRLTWPGGEQTLER